MAGWLVPRLEVVRYWREKRIEEGGALGGSSGAVEQCESWTTASKQQPTGWFLETARAWRRSPCAWPTAGSHVLPAAIPEGKASPEVPLVAGAHHAPNGHATKAPSQGEASRTLSPVLSNASNRSYGRTLSRGASIQVGLPFLLRRRVLGQTSVGVLVGCCVPWRRGQGPLTEGSGPLHQHLHPNLSLPLTPGCPNHPPPPNAQLRVASLAHPLAPSFVAPPTLVGIWRRRWQAIVAMFFMYVVTLSIFPGFLAEDVKVGGRLWALAARRSPLPEPARRPLWDAEPRNGSRSALPRLWSPLPADGARPAARKAPQTPGRARCYRAERRAGQLVPHHPVFGVQRRRPGRQAGAPLQVRCCSTAICAFRFCFGMLEIGGRVTLLASRGSLLLHVVGTHTHPRNHTLHKT